MEPAEGKAAEAEAMPPKAGGCQPRHGHEKIARYDYGIPGWPVITEIKRRKVLGSLKIKYHCLGENVLKETLPDPTAYTSKRKWETAIRKARETLWITDELAFHMEPGALRRRLDDMNLSPSKRTRVAELARGIARVGGDTPFRVKSAKW